MKLNSPLRRAATVLAGALLGLTGLAVTASPASAHDATVSGVAGCETGVRTVTWTLTNDWTTDATVTELNATPNPVEGEQIGRVIPQADGQGWGNWTHGKLVLTQRVDAGATEATLSFRPLWPDIRGEVKTGRVQFTEPCAPSETPCVENAQAKFHHTFAVKEDGSTATVTLNDGIKLCKGEPVTLVSYFAPKPQFSVPQYVFDQDTDEITNEQRSVTLTVNVPKCNTQVDLFFGGKDDVIQEITQHGKRYGDRKLGVGRGLGGRSEGPQGWYNGGSKSCQTPMVEPLPQCDGTVNVNLSNDGLTNRYPIAFTVKAGAFTKTVTVTKGKGATVVVPAGSGTITVSAPDMPDRVYNWTPPAACALPSIKIENNCKTVTITVQNPKGVMPATAKVTYGDKTKSMTVAAGGSEKVTFDVSKAKFATIDFPGLNVESIKATLGKVDCSGGGGGGGDGDGDSDEPGLPVTGPVAGSIAGVAALLLIGGGVFFFIARRRKVTFTA